jgi:hypothetical protein
MNRKARPVLIIAGVIAVIQAIISTAGITDIINKDVMSYLTLANVALTAVLGVLAQNKVVPVEDAAAYVDQHGNMVAGPASPPEIKDGEVVNVQMAPVGAAGGGGQVNGPIEH